MLGWKEGQPLQLTAVVASSSNAKGVAMLLLHSSLSSTKKHCILHQKNPAVYGHSSQQQNPIFSLEGLNAMLGWKEGQPLQLTDSGYFLETGQGCGNLIGPSGCRNSHVCQMGHEIDGHAFVHFCEF